MCVALYVLHIESRSLNRPTFALICWTDSYFSAASEEGKKLTLKSLVMLADEEK
jgi:hypothetical protein